jgi:electron transport complex protein RnfC
MTAMAMTELQAGDYEKRRLRGGVHPPECKELSAACPIESIPAPTELLIPLGQHIGAPAKAIIKPRTDVRMGEKIAEAAGMVSASVHAPLPGKVGLPTVTTLATGRRSDALPITVAADAAGGIRVFDALLGEPWDLAAIDALDGRQILTAVQEAGIVGGGGAAFPTHVKLMPMEKRPVDTLIVNGCECEPYLTADYRLMLEAPEAVAAGLLLARKACGAERVIVAIEDNKPQAIRAMGKAVANLSNVKLVVCKTRYPMGGERQLIPAVTKRKVPVGALPLDVGVVVLNVGTAAAVAGACLRGQPMTHRIVTVTGQGIARPANLLVPVGARFADLIRHCGGLKPEARRILAGGPMMGFAVSDLNTPVTKGTSGITVLAENELDWTRQTNCLKCGRCVDVCPLNLVPTRIALAVKAGNLDLAQKSHLAACCECGCCSYVCPARVPLVQYMRAGKVALARFQALARSK